MPRGCASVSQGQSLTYLVNSGTTTQTVSTIGARDGSLPTRNRSIASDGGTPVRKIPRKAASFFVPRSDTTFSLPERSPPEPDRERFRRQSSKSFRASESGKGDLLPTMSSSGMNRARTMSSTNLRVPMWSRRKPLTSSSSTEQHLTSLRRRSTSVQRDDIERSNSQHLQHVNQSWSDMDPDPSSRIRKSYLRRDLGFNQLILSLKPAFLLQLAVVFVVAFLVWDSHHKALLTTEKLHQFRHSESMLMLHLQRIEQQSIHLHENLIQLHVGSDAANKNSKGQKPAASVDSDLIRKQMQQLKQMEEELEHEVRSLQSKIQQSARNSIIHSYGEGPVQVMLEVDIGESNGSSDEKEEANRISILLWHDTPHAAWTWLQQIESGAWNNVPWELAKGLTIDAAITLPEESSKLQFVEKAQKAHEAWTVGFSNMEGGGSGIFVNLKDNTDFHRHEVCVGKILDGFNVLQKLVEVSRRHSEDDAPHIRIKSATASHLTRRETSGLP